MILSVFIWTFCSQANRVHRGRLGGGSKQSPKKPFSSAWLEKEPLWTPVNELSSAPLAQNNHYRRKLEERGRKEACEDDTRRNICISVQQLLFSLRKKPNTRYLLFISGQAHTHTHTHVNRTWAPVLTPDLSLIHLMNLSLCFFALRSLNRHRQSLISHQQAPVSGCEQVSGWKRRINSGEERYKEVLSGLFPERQSCIVQGWTCCVGVVCAGSEEQNNRAWYQLLMTTMRTFTGLIE